ncbi:MAG: hypothetical protein K5773_00570 [Pseudobutyrivibrio sp.]|nr:hypothetical protein [Pseudobutyrivibrio sp.]
MLLLWLCISVPPIILSFFKRREAFRCHKDKKKLMRELLYAIKDSKDLRLSLRELTLVFSRKSRVGKAIRMGIKKTENPTFTAGDLLTYLAKKLKCPVFSVMGHSLDLDRRGHDAAIIGLLGQLVDAWDRQSLLLYKRKGAQWIIAFIYKEGFLITNLVIYFYFRNEFSLIIAVVINTVGLLIFAILFLNWNMEDSHTNEGKLAFINSALDAVILSLDNSEELQIASERLSRYLQGDFLQEKKTPAPGAALRKVFQTAGAAGLMLNLVMVLERFVQQAV